jgi:hypothetical protein
MTFHIHALGLIAYRQLSFTLLFVKSLGSHIQLVPQPTSHGYHAFGLKLKERRKPFWELIRGGSVPIRYGNQHPPLNHEGLVVGGQETVFLLLCSSCLVKGGGYLGSTYA